MSLIETELLRQQVYTVFLQEVFEKLKDKLKWKEIKHLMLRYVFNRIAGRQLEAPEHHRFQSAEMSDADINTSISDLGDPVFCHHESKWADLQLEHDFVFNKIQETHGTVLKWIPQRFKEMCSNLKNKLDLSMLKPVSEIHNVPQFIPHSKKLVYTSKNGQRMELADISNLGALYPKYLEHAMALQIRYRYLNLENHGLAFPYANFGHGLGTTSYESTLEGFASAFNHYFPNFCSAFPDLERPYGSLGSFFMMCNSGNNNNVVSSKFSKWMVNPVFDETIMNNVVTQILKLYEAGYMDQVKITCIFPDWKDFQGALELKNSIYAENVQMFPKGQLKFIQHFQVPPIQISPCDILFVELGVAENSQVPENLQPLTSASKRQKLEE